jgi:hypothetical protein
LKAETIFRENGGPGLSAGVVQFRGTSLGQDNGISPANVHPVLPAQGPGTEDYLFVCPETGMK